MVKIAVAGGSGNIAQEIIDVLAATKKHEILLLSRKDASSENLAPGVTWVKANYGSVDKLAQVLEGVDTLLSLIVTHSDPGNVSQRNLIDAAVRASVRRFAPSEWATSSFEYMPWYDGKAEIREYLKELNKDKKILEYTLFQPGLLTNYFTGPHMSSKHIHPMETPLDFGGRRFIIMERMESVPITLTTVQDLANVVARAVEYEGEWPAIGGIKGDELTIEQIIKLAKKVRGGPAHIDRLKKDDLKAGVVKSSWLPKADHPSFTPEQVKAMSEVLTAGILLGISVGAMNVSDEWNKLLPDYEFTKAEDFLAKEWRDKS
ncbi:hypothetical protein N0V88_007453 [Collariella sp. IMI 366227]|nr:hypothetical protein N0V88_007453 [Collariella sp. IMI 366227]